ncbi:MAG: hypothetical protein OEZ01_13185, partial [Candidatus Heimdallarchaeota archaeon]|nr:hypothetical protein [Candidatus Heimdallarchaeota archaeon]
KGFNFIFDEFVKLFAKLLKIEPPYGKKYNYSLVMGLAVFLEIYYKLTGNSNERKLSRYRIRTLTSQRTLDDSKFREKYMFTPNISPEKSIQDWIQVANNE